MEHGGFLESAMLGPRQSDVLTARCFLGASREERRGPGSK